MFLLLVLTFRNTIRASYSFGFRSGLMFNYELIMWRKDGLHWRKNGLHYYVLFSKCLEGYAHNELIRLNMVAGL